MNNKRSAEETLELFKQALQKRRDYLRRRLDSIKKAEVEDEKGRGRKRGRSPETYRGFLLARGGMLSEIATVTAMLNDIENGKSHPDELYKVEDDPSEIC